MDLLPLKIKCQIFDLLSDFDIVNVILSCPQFECSAGYILRKRNLSLIRLFVEKNINTKRKTFLVQAHNSSSSITIKAKEDNEYDPAHSFRVSLPYRTIENRDNYLKHLIRVICVLLKYYDVFNADLDLMDLNCSETTGSILTAVEMYLGTTKHSSLLKIKTSFLSLTNPVICPILHYIVPTVLLLNLPNRYLFDNSGQLMATGVDTLLLFYDDTDIVDQVIEQSDAKHIELGLKTYWSAESFFRVLTAHSKCEINSPPKTITCPICDNLAVENVMPHMRCFKEWHTMFTSWWKLHKYARQRITLKINRKITNYITFEIN